MWEAYFSTGPRPLTLAGLELHYCLSNATTILDMVYYMPLNVDRTVSDTTMAGRSTSSPTLRWPTPAAARGPTGAVLLFHTVRGP